MRSRAWVLAAAIGLLTAPAATAAPKQPVAELGGPVAGEVGGMFGGPSGVAVNLSGAGGVPAGTLYIAEAQNRRVQRISPDGSFVSAWGLGVLDGSPSPQLCTTAEACRAGLPHGTGNPSTPAALNAPGSVAVDQLHGIVYVVDEGIPWASRVSAFSADGTFEGAFGWGAINASSSFQFCTRLTGCAPSSSPFGNGQGGSFSEGRLGIAVGPAGEIYVANSGYRRLDVFEPSFVDGFLRGVEFVRSIGWGVRTGAAALEVCEESSSCRVGGAGDGPGQFAAAGPSAVAVDGAGRLVVLDPGNDRLQVFSPAGAPLDAAFGATALAAVFGGGELLDLTADPTPASTGVFVAGQRAGTGGRVAVAELDGAGDNALGGAAAHGEALRLTAAEGLAATPPGLGGNLLLSSDSAELRGLAVLGVPPRVTGAEPLSANEAMLHGEVFSGGLAVSFRFERSPPGGPWVPASGWTAAGTAGGAISVEQRIEGLSGNRSYAVRLVQRRPAGGGLASSEPVPLDTPRGPPRVLGGVADPVRQDGATLLAYLDPQNEPTTYRFEYGPQPCSSHPCTALPAQSLAGGAARLVAQAVDGLPPGSRYSFRLLAVNGSGEQAGPDRAFSTFAAGTALPDGRAHELVTPPETGAVVPGAVGFGNGGCFGFFPSDGSGDSVLWMSRGGALAELPGNGNQDLYQSLRTPSGWRTLPRGATYAETEFPRGLCASPDHAFATLVTGTPPQDGGTLVRGGPSSYLRGPGGATEALGWGELGSDPAAVARWVSAVGANVVFSSRERLEPLAPAGVESVYARAAGAPARLVSRPPAAAGQAERDAFAAGDARYRGASDDGEAVSFAVGTGLYLARGGETRRVAADRGAAVGTELTCSTTSSAAEVSYRWLRDGTPIAAAESRSYVLSSADAGRAVQCQVRVANPNAGASQASNPAVAVEPRGETAPPLAPANIGQPAQSGTLNVPGPPADRTLTCSPGTWSGAESLGYAWYRNGVPIDGATAPTYVVAAGSLAAPAAFQCAVTGANEGGAVVRLSASRLTSPAPSAPATPAANASTGDPEAVFAGLAEQGRALFYEQRGDLFAYEWGSGAGRQVVAGGGARFVNVAADGSRAYFVSSLALAGSGADDSGAPPVAGAPNLYLWERPSGATRFVATVEPADVQGDESLVRWSAAVGPLARSEFLGRGSATSRSSSDGSVLVFESRAALAGSAGGGDAVRIYRYDAQAPPGRRLRCVSCPPLGGAPVADSRLQVTSSDPATARSLNALARVENLAADGERVFFESAEPLVPGDGNGTWDVYEWRLGEQAYLLSSGRAAQPSHLYGVGGGGRDVFFTTAERLLAADPSGVVSIYDARAGGGFATPAPALPCQGSACLGPPSQAPARALPASAAALGPGERAGANPRDRRRARKRRAQARRKRARARRAAARRQASRAKARHQAAGATARGRR